MKTDGFHNHKPTQLVFRNDMRKKFKESMYIFLALFDRVSIHLILLTKH